jgi:hypothetical protein
MTRTWDIVDNYEPTVQFTVIKKHPPKLTGCVSSAMQSALLLTVVFGSSNDLMVIKSHKVTAGISVHQKKGSQSISSVVRGVVSDTDTQVGQSSVKLARSFSAFFQPASDEDEYDDDYSFA